MMREGKEKVEAAGRRIMQEQHSGLYIGKSATAESKIQLCYSLLAEGVTA